MKRRIFLMLFGLTPMLIGKVFASDDAIYAPCSFLFNASHSDVTLIEQFRVKEHRNYTITLQFLHHGGVEAEVLHKLLDDEEALFLTDSIQSGAPMKVTYEYFMEKTLSYSIHEKNNALTEAVGRYNEARRAAIASRFTGNKGKFSFLPQNTRGLIPLFIRLSSLDSDGNRKIVFENNFDTLGFASGGNGRFTRHIAGAALRPGVTYEVMAKTVRDSPLFFNAQIQLGITFDPRLSRIKD